MSGRSQGGVWARGGIWGQKGVRVEGGWVPHDNTITRHAHDSIRPSRLTAALGLKMTTRNKAKADGTYVLV